jgi:hypothetical protein
LGLSGNKVDSFAPFFFGRLCRQVEIGMICEFHRIPREMLICLQEVQFNNSFLLCIFENIPKETKLDAEKIVGEKKNNTSDSEQFFFNRLICLPAGPGVDYL